MSNQIRYEDCQEFNDFLDSDRNIEIKSGKLLVTRDYEVSLSRTLFDADPIGYAQAYAAYLDDEFEKLKEVVFFQYPSIIAHHFRLSEKGIGANDPIQKLLHLKDTWEAIIFILHAMIWGEVRKKQINVNAAQVFVSFDPGGNPVYATFNTGRVFSDALKQKLYNIQAIIRYSKQQNLSLKCEIISEDLIDYLLKLQDIRNDISHHAAPTRAEAESELRQVIPLFRDMLPETEFLQRCRIFRFENYGANCQCEEFNGYSLRSEYQGLAFQGADLAYVLALGQQHLFVVWDNDCFSVSPFLHFVPDGQGHESYLSVYKGRRNGEFVFEPVKLRAEQTFPPIQARFDIEKTEIQNLIQ
jgi:hypothetical protein